MHYATPPKNRRETRVFHKSADLRAPHYLALYPRCILLRYFHSNPAMTGTGHIFSYRSVK